MEFFHAAVPEVATSRTKARTTGFFYLTGGLAGFAVAGGLGEWPTRRAVVWLVAGGALLSGAGLLAWGRHLPREAFHLIVLGATALVSLTVAVAPQASSAVALTAIYAFIAVDAFFFFAWPAAIAHLTVMLAAQTVALSVQGQVGAEVSAALGVVWVAVSVVVGSIVRVASGAHLDSLTGVANRRGWDDALSAALDLVDRRPQPLSVALIDLDHFKRVNDEQGHDAGDDLLCRVAADWSRGLPDGAVLGRRGGDEFALLLPGLAGETALQLVERIRVGCPHRAVSCGVAEHVPGETGGDLLRRADAALYAAKAQGRGRCVLTGAGTGPVRHRVPGPRR